jgi:hypothetical protein
MRFFIITLMSIFTLQAQASDPVIGICTCDSNNGPDLMLNVLDGRSGSLLWSRKLQGWNESPDNWATCRQMQLSNACR